jgi:hypothetical protein
MKVKEEAEEPTAGQTKRRKKPARFAYRVDG